MYTSTCVYVCVIIFAWLKLIITLMIYPCYNHYYIKNSIIISFLFNIHIHGFRYLFKLSWHLAVWQMILDDSWFWCVTIIIAMPLTHVSDVNIFM